jgi:hypothetical protein
MEETMFKNYFIVSLPFFAFLLFASPTVSAQETQYLSNSSLLDRQESVAAQLASTGASAVGGCDACDSACGTSCGCCCGGSWTANAELLFLRFHEADGVDNDESNGVDEYDFNTCPRLTVGYTTCDGLSTRIRYFEHDHSATIDGDPRFSVDTYNVDFELAQKFQIGCVSSVEFNGGIRYNGYEHQEEDDVIDESFNGIGIFLGLEGTRGLGCANVYGRARHAILMGDSDDPADDHFRGDVVLGQLELGIGVEVERCFCGGSVLALRAGVEMQQWFGYEDDEEDVGFGGFLVGASWNY